MNKYKHSVYNLNMYSVEIGIRKKEDRDVSYERIHYKNHTLTMDYNADRYPKLRNYYDTQFKKISDLEEKIRYLRFKSI